MPLGEHAAGKRVSARGLLMKGGKECETVKGILGVGDMRGAGSQADRQTDSKQEEQETEEESKRR